MQVFATDPYPIGPKVSFPLSNIVQDMKFCFKISQNHMPWKIKIVTPSLAKLIKSHARNNLSSKEKEELIERE